MTITARLRLAKLFMNGRSQSVRLPAEFRFPGNEVYIRHDAVTGDVILSPVPLDWRRMLEARKVAMEHKETMGFLETREQEQHERDPFEGWKE